MNEVQQTTKEGFMAEGAMDFVGKIYEIKGKTNRGEALGNLYWAGERFPHPGLYMWNGEENVLVRSREEIDQMMTGKG
jgi:hypothetical protein